MVEKWLLNRILPVLFAAFLFFSCENPSGEVSLEDSVGYYTEMLEDLPQEPTVYYNRGIFYFRSGKYNEAIDDFSNAIRLNPGFYAAFLPRADCQRMLGNFSQAARDYDTCLMKTGGNAYVYNSLAYCNFRLRDYSSAAINYSKVIALGKASGETYQQRGISFYKTGNYESAASDFVQAIKLMPDSGAAYIWLGNTEYKLGFYPDAVANYELAVEKKAVFNFENSRSQAYLERALLVMDEQPDQAIADLNQSIAADSANGKAYYQLGMVIRKQGDNETACTQFKKAGLLGVTAAFKEAKTCCDPATW